jgi:biopolymer transport protein ExbB/TolQ
MSGIAEALVATGVGLLVALPAVAAYNTLTRVVERRASATEVLAHEILARLKTAPASAASARPAEEA